MKLRPRLFRRALLGASVLLLGAVHVATGHVAADGRLTILFVSVDDSGQFEETAVEITRPEGTGRRKLGFGDTASWSPDGSRVAFSAYREDTDSRELFVVRTASPHRVVRLTRTPEDDGAADWSPDGRLLAFTGGREGAHEVRLVAPDGTGLRTVSPGVHVGWSPDGTRLASLRGAELWITRRDGTAPFSLGRAVEVHEYRGAEVERPAWSPDGSRLAFVADHALWVVSVEGGTPMVVGRHGDDRPEQLRWSPDGTRIAYIVRPYNPNGLPTLWLADVSGGTARRLGSVGATRPAWTPDGTTLVFERGGVSDCGYKIGCDLEGYPGESSPPLNGIYAINADGTRQRRLTSNYDAAPAVSPSGSHVLFARIVDAGHEVELRLAGLAGGCTRRVARTSDFHSFAWRPGTSSPAPIHCVDLRAHVSKSTVGGLGSPFEFEYVIRNLGDRVAADVRLTVLLPVVFRPRPAGPCAIARRGSYSNTVVCRLGLLRPGARSRAVIEGALRPLRRRDAMQDRTLTTEWVHAEATARGDDSDALNNVAEMPLTISRCTHTGTTKGDRITGTARGDYICGSYGADHLRGLAGDDVLDGGVDGDVLEPGPGRDVVRARGGDDIVRAADGEIDIVACGNGVDRVVADSGDRVDTNCEHIERARGARPGQG